MNLLETIRKPRTHKYLGFAALLLVLWAVVGFLVLPRILRGVIERKLAESLHRPVTLRGLSLNPFALSATLEGLAVGDKRASGSFLSFERVYVNLEAVSLLRRAPVIREITLTKPSINVVRNEDGTYNFQDLLDEASKPDPKPHEPARFSVNNIRIEDGSADFDDRLKRVRHTVRSVKVGIPFLSNIPSQVEITTQPVFEARVNGAPFALHGTTKPFSPTRETEMELDLSDVDLPYYLAYLPAGAFPRLTSGRLDMKLSIRFAQPPAGSSTLVLSGRSTVRSLAVENDGRPWLAWERLDAVFDSFDLVGRSLRVRSVTAVAPEVWIRRGGVAVADRERAAAPPAKPSPAEAPGRPMSLEVADLKIARGTIHYDDLTLDAPFRAVIRDVAVSVRGFSNAPGPGHKAFLDLTAKTDAGETLKNAGTVSMEPFALEGALEIGGLPLKRYRAYFDHLVTFDVDDGVLDLRTKYRFSTGTGGGTALSELTARLGSPRFRKRGEKDPFFQAPSVELASSAFDFAKREIALGKLSSATGVLAVARDKNGDADLTKLFAAPPPDSPPEPPSPPWNVALQKLALDGYTIRIDDHATVRRAQYALTKMDLALDGFSTAPGKKAALSVRFGINGHGLASASGPVGIRPTYADLKADVKRLDLVPLEAYVLSGFRLSMSRGNLTANGTLSLREDAGGKPSIGFAGKALVADLLTVDPDTKLDFFKWDAFSLEGTKAGYNPTFLQVARLAITGVACDLIIEADGTVNLSKVMGKTPGAAEEEVETERKGDGNKDSETTTSAAASPVVPTPSAAPIAKPGEPVSSTSAAEDRVPIRIDTLLVENGRIGLADHLIKPSYAATIANLSGRMTGLSTDPGTVAQLDLRGNLANRSPLEISGRVNPLAATAFADVKATFRDIDLPAFTPYSGKYAGYAIARGTLTMEVQYKLQNRKLSAENRFLVDQFELGDKVESKDATKLPVRLAVSLLKDKDGLIDLDLPIEGSLDDPKFRLGKVIWQVLGNLIGKAATAPFALLGKLLGGKGEELSSIDFADGRSNLDDAAKKKLDTLAKALNGRPALKLDVAGRFSGDRDSEGLRRLLLERRVKAQKLSDLARKGESGQSSSGADAVVLDEKEYATYLAKAYKKEKFSKPRNALGLAKDIPVPEMETLILENLRVTPDDLRQLALSRANAVKEDLTGRGAVDASRVFVLEPGDKPAPPAEKARASRVDFVLK